jgi:serralysin
MKLAVFGGMGRGENPFVIFPGGDMAANVSGLTTMVYSGDVRVDSLLDDVPAWNFWPDGRNVLYFTFDTSAGSEIATKTSTAVTRFNTAQQQAAREILQHAASVTGINFVEVSGGAQADVHFGATNLQGASVAGLASTYYGYSYLQDGSITRLNAEALVYLDNVEHAGINSQPFAGSGGYEVLLHEVGHMLGLAHPFSSPRPLTGALDHTDNTVMSYTDRGGNKSVFQPYDLLALDWLYGRDGLGGVWGFNSANGPSLAMAVEPLRFVGTALPDLFRSTSASENFDGLGGVDTLVLQGPRADYTVSAASQAQAWTISDRVAGRDGSDSVQQLERLKFADVNLALDLDGLAGSTARLMGVVLGNGALANREWVGVGLQLADGGASASALSTLALQVALGFTYSNDQVVNLLYSNLFHAAPDASTRAALTGLLNSGVYTPASLVQVAASSDLNAGNIGLVGMQSHGLEYVVV